MNKYTSVQSGIITACKAEVQKAIYDALDSEHDNAWAVVEFKNTSIDMFIKSDEQVTIEFNNEDGEKARKLPLLKEAIFLALPLWQTVKDEWQADRDAYDYWDANGFVDEADYWHTMGL